MCSHKAGSLDSNTRCLGMSSNVHPLLPIPTTHRSPLVHFVPPALSAAATCALRLTSWSASSTWPSSSAPSMRRWVLVCTSNCSPYRGGCSRVASALSLARALLQTHPWILCAIVCSVRCSLFAPQASWLAAYAAEACQ